MRIHRTLIVAHGGSGSLGLLLAAVILWRACPEVRLAWGSVLTLSLLLALGAFVVDKRPWKS